VSTTEEPSHDTALSLHELSDIMTSKLHMTVPKHFRRNSLIPEVLLLHRADLGEGTCRRCTACALHARCVRFWISSKPAASTEL
jgi:hypothetical protein